MERWDILDAEGKNTGRTMVRGERLTSGQYHLVVHLWIVNSNGRLLIQKRAAHLRLMPDTWAITGGSAIAGEDSLTAARRELLEELGVQTKPEDLQFMGRLRRRNSHCDLWLLQRDLSLGKLRLQKEEVASVAWVSRRQLINMVRQRTFHNYGRPYFDWVMAHIDQLTKERPYAEQSADPADGKKNGPAG